jgi:hypothetical protein
MTQNKKIISILIIIFFSFLFVSSSAYAIEERDLEQPWEKQVREMEESKKAEGMDQSEDKQSSQNSSDQSNSDDQPTEDDETADYSDTY